MVPCVLFQYGNLHWCYKVVDINTAGACTRGVCTERLEAGMYPSGQADCQSALWAVAPSDQY